MAFKLWFLQEWNSKSRLITGVNYNVGFLLLAHPVSLLPEDFLLSVMLQQSGMAKERLYRETKANRQGKGLLSVFSL